MAAYKRKVKNPLTGEVTWSEFYYIKYIDRNGKPVNHLAKDENGRPTTSKRLAEEIEARERYGDPKAPPPPSGPTNQATLEKYRNHLALNAASTLRCNESRIEYWIHVFEGKTMGDVTRDDVNAGLLALKDNGNPYRKDYGRGTKLARLRGKKVKLADSTLKGYLGTLKAAYAAVDPEHPVAVMKSRLKYGKRLIVWTDEELSRLMPLLPLWCQRLVYILCLTGMRLGDALRMKYAYIHDGFIEQPQEKADDEMTPITLNERAKEFFTLLKAAQPKGAVYVFPGGCGPDGAHNRHSKTGHLSESTAWSYLEPARIAVGCPEKHFHDMRRTFASKLFNAGVSVPLIAGLLGQKTTSVTGRYTVMEQSALALATKKACLTLPTPSENATVLLPQPKRRGTKARENKGIMKVMPKRAKRSARAAQIA